MKHDAQTNPHTPDGATDPEVVDEKTGEATPHSRGIREE